MEDAREGFEVRRYASYAVCSATMAGKPCIASCGCSKTSPQNICERGKVTPVYSYKYCTIRIARVYRAVYLQVALCSCLLVNRVLLSADVLMHCVLSAA